MKSKQRGYTGIVLMIWLVFIFGYVANIVQIVQTMPPSLAETTPMWIVKSAGIFVAPVGSVLGYIGLF
jgi:hypothetical protein